MAVGLRKSLITLLNEVRCNGEKIFTTSILVASGAQLSVLVSWANSWATGSARLEYYQTSSEGGKAELAKGNIDFALTGNALGGTWRETIPDAGVLPIAALPLVPGTTLSLAWASGDPSI